VSVRAVMQPRAVLLSAGLNFIQTYRAQSAVTSLRAQLAPTATVLRDGDWPTCPAALVS